MQELVLVLQPKNFTEPSKILVRAKVKKQIGIQTILLMEEDNVLQFGLFGYSEIYSMFDTNQLKPSKFANISRNMSK